MLTCAPQHTTTAEEHWVTARDGVKLYVRRYRPEGSRPARAVLWSHGMCEHGGRYEHVVAEFLARGWEVILGDLRGHGLSGGLRADVDTFETYLTDFDAIAQELSVDPQRTALFGNSMGGLIMTRYAETRRDQWPALALAAPLFGVAVKVPWWKRRLGDILMAFAPTTHLTAGLRESNMTSDPEFLAARHADQFLQNSVSVRWYFAMQAALKDVYEDAEKVTLPVLILQGLKDKTTDPEAPKYWMVQARSRDLELVEYSDALHELLNDRGWQAVCGKLLDWLDQRVPG